MWRRTVLLAAFGALASSCAAVHKEAGADENLVFEDQRPGFLFKVSREQDGFYIANLHLYREGAIHDEFWTRVESFCGGRALRVSDGGVCFLNPLASSSSNFVGYCKSERFRCGAS
jgi:hypothetical protein